MGAGARANCQEEHRLDMMGKSPQGARSGIELAASLYLKLNHSPNNKRKHIFFSPQKKEERYFFFFLEINNRRGSVRSTYRDYKEVATISSDVFGKASICCVVCVAESFSYFYQVHFHCMFQFIII